MRLVYEPLPHIVSFRADGGIPLNGGSDQKTYSISFEPLRELDMSDQLGIVWRDRKWRDDENRSLKRFFHRRTQDTVKVKIEKEWPFAFVLLV